MYNSKYQVKRLILSLMALTATEIVYGGMRQAVRSLELPQAAARQITSAEERARINKYVDNFINKMDEVAISHIFTEQHKVTSSFNPDPIAIPGAPGYFIKTDSSRVVGAKAFSDCIEKHKLQHVVVAEKWLYEIPDNIRKKHKISEKFLVVAKNVERAGGGRKSINLFQAKDVCCLLRNAHCFGRYYLDLTDENVFCDSADRLAFVDMERKGFDGPTPVGGLKMLSIKRNVDADAREFVEQELAEVDTFYWGCRYRMRANPKTTIALSIIGLISIGFFAWKYFKKK